MPPPLGAGGIMFSGCPSVRPSVRPSEAWNTLFWRYFDLVKRVKFGVSGHFLENTWRKWPEILHAYVSWPPSELISLWPRSVDFSNFGAILT